MMEIIAPPRLDQMSNGMRMTAEEFDAVTDYNRAFEYELINGVVIVTPIAGEWEADPVDELGRLLRNYQEEDPKGANLDDTLRNRYIIVGDDRRIADRVIWAGLGRRPDPTVDVPTIAVEFVSRGKRNRDRDYIAKRKEYLAVGVKEYWIIDRFQRTMTVVRPSPTGPIDTVIAENEMYMTPLLPGFSLPLAKILARADRWA